MPRDEGVASPQGILMPRWRARLPPSRSRSWRQLTTETPSHRGSISVPLWFKKEPFPCAILRLKIPGPILNRRPAHREARPILSIACC